MQMLKKISATATPDSKGRNPRTMRFTESSRHFLSRALSSTEIEYLHNAAMLPKAHRRADQLLSTKSLSRNIAWPQSWHCTGEYRIMAPNHREAVLRITDISSSLRLKLFAAIARRCKRARALLPSSGLCA